MESLTSELDKFEYLTPLMSPFLLKLCCPRISCVPNIAKPKDTFHIAIEIWILVERLGSSWAECWSMSPQCFNSDLSKFTLIVKWLSIISQNNDDGFVCKSSVLESTSFILYAVPFSCSAFQGRVFYNFMYITIPAYLPID